MKYFFKIKLDDIANGCKITIPEKMPVFSYSHKIGEATNVTFDKGIISADFDCVDNLITNNQITLTLGGVVKKKEGNVIKQFKLTEVSLTSQQI